MIGKIIVLIFVLSILFNIGLLYSFLNDDKEKETSISESELTTKRVQAQGNEAGLSRTQIIKVIDAELG